MLANRSSTSSSIPSDGNGFLSFPISKHLEDDRSQDDTIARTQLSVVLAWALTPWKAQGMSLEKVVVKIGAAASRPGVAFTSLTRARHPDGLAIDDDFPVMSTFQKQKHHRSFQKRQRWERAARVKFSATIRRHMRDARVYGPELAWTESDAAIADSLLRFLRQHRECPDDDFVALFYHGLQDATGFAREDCDRVWSRLRCHYPHMFEVASARQTLDTLRLDGTAKSNDAEVADMTYKGWKVPIADLELYSSATNHVPFAVFGLFVRVLQELHLPSLSRETYIAYAPWMQLPDRTEDRLHALLRKYRRVLLPYYERDGNAWSLVVLSRTDCAQTPLGCDIHHWHKQKQSRSTHSQPAFASV